MLSLTSCCCFRRDAPIAIILPPTTSTWLVESKAEISRCIDPLLPPLVRPEHIRLLRLLRDPLAQQELGIHAKSCCKTHLLMCWTEIEEFKGMDVISFKKNKATAIYETVSRLKYVLMIYES